MTLKDKIENLYKGILEATEDKRTVPVFGSGAAIGSLQEQDGPYTVTAHPEGSIEPRFSISKDDYEFSLRKGKALYNGKKLDEDDAEAARVWAEIVDWAIQKYDL